jgi:hypothetical protein
MGWRGRLQDQYFSWNEFKNCADIYGVVKRLGYKTAKAAWEDNPMVEGSTDPSDYRRVTFGTGEAVAIELERIGFTRAKDEQGIYLQRHDFLAKVIDYGTIGMRSIEGTHDIEIYFAEQKTFDRWANSKNFVVKIDASNPYNSYVDIEKAVRFAKKICRSKVFNFNRYFHAIDLT